MRELDVLINRNPYNDNVAGAAARMIYYLIEYACLNDKDLQITDANNASIEFELVEHRDKNVLFYCEGRRNQACVVREITKIDLMLSIHCYQSVDGESMLTPQESYIQIHAANGVFRIENTQESPD